MEQEREEELEWDFQYFGTNLCVVHLLCLIEDFSDKEYAIAMEEFYKTEPTCWKCGTPVPEGVKFAANLIGIK